MLTSKPKKKKRGRQPPKYGKAVCPWCATALKMNHVGLYCPNIPACNWKE